MQRKNESNSIDNRIDQILDLFAFKLEMLLVMGSLHISAIKFFLARNHDIIEDA